MVRHHATSGIVVRVDIARQFFDATLVTHPLYDPEGMRMKSYELEKVLNVQILFEEGDAAPRMSVSTIFLLTLSD
jgi:hypothetical protein